MGFEVRFLGHSAICANLQFARLVAKGLVLAAEHEEECPAHIYDQSQDAEGDGVPVPVEYVIVQLLPNGERSTISGQGKCPEELIEQALMDREDRLDAVA